MHIPTFFQQGDVAPQKQKRSLKSVSQKMATMTKVDMNKKEVQAISQLNNGQPYEAKSFKMLIARPKMDLNRALRIMGYTSSKEFLDTSKDPTKDPKQELQKKHFVQSMALFAKKTKAQEDKSTFRNKKQISADDEVRLLHEAYQFLVRKYHLQSDTTISNDDKSKKSKGDEKMETGEDDDE